MKVLPRLLKEKEAYIRDLLSLTFNGVAQVFLYHPHRGDVVGA